MKKPIKQKTFIENQIMGGKNAGPNQPPKNNTVMSEEISTRPRY